MRKRIVLSALALLGLAAIMAVTAGWQDPFPCLPGKPGCKPITRPAPVPAPKPTTYVVGTAAYWITILLWGVLARLIFHQRLSAFKVYVWWSLIRVSVLFTLFVTQWDHYSDAYWATRGITIALTGVVVGELWGQTVAGFALAFPAGLVEFAGSYIAIDREFGFAVCAACVLRLIWPYRLLQTTVPLDDMRAEIRRLRQRPRRHDIALGLLVLTLFPAIAETPYVLQFGGWLRYTPVFACLAFQLIVIKGISDNGSILKLFDYETAPFQAHKRRNAKPVAGRARQA